MARILWAGFSLNSVFMAIFGAVFTVVSAIKLDSTLAMDLSVGSSFPLPDPDRRPEVEKSGLPLWQFGFGAGGGVAPHYPASDQSSLRFLASPTFRYRGRVLRSDDEGTRARLLRFQDSEIDVSGAASFPVSGSENEARRGMEPLDWVGEIGPRLNLRWKLSSEKKTKSDILRLMIPFRVVTSSDGSSLAHQGFIFQPGLSFTRVLNAPKAFDSEISVEIQTRIAVIDAMLGDFYFGVAPLEATPTRPGYKGSSGLLSIGTGLTINVSPTTALNSGSSFFAGIYHSNTSVSANRSSPLHKSDSQFIFFAGLNILWINSETENL